MTPDKEVITKLATVIGQSKCRCDEKGEISLEHIFYKPRCLLHTLNLNSAADVWVFIEWIALAKGLHLKINTGYRGSQSDQYGQSIWFAYHEHTTHHEPVFVDTEEDRLRPRQIFEALFLALEGPDEAKTQPTDETIREVVEEREEREGSVLCPVCGGKGYDIVLSSGKVCSYCGSERK